MEANKPKVIMQVKRIDENEITVRCTDIAHIEVFQIIESLMESLIEKTPEEGRLLTAMGLASLAKKQLQQLMKKDNAPKEEDLNLS